MVFYLSKKSRFQHLIIIDWNLLCDIYTCIPLNSTNTMLTDIFTTTTLTITLAIAWMLTVVSGTLMCITFQLFIKLHMVLWFDWIRWWASICNHSSSISSAWLLEIIRNLSQMIRNSCLNLIGEHTSRSKGQCAQNILLYVFTGAWFTIIIPSYWLCRNIILLPHYS